MLEMSKGYWEWKGLLHFKLFENGEETSISNRSIIRTEAKIHFRIIFFLLEWYDSRNHCTNIFPPFCIMGLKRCKYTYTFNVRQIEIDYPDTKSRSNNYVTSMLVQFLCHVAGLRVKAYLPGHKALSLTSDAKYWKLSYFKGHLTSLNCLNLPFEIYYCHSSCHWYSI